MTISKIVFIKLITLPFILGKLTKHRKEIFYGFSQKIGY